jgi:hypothetical protein
MTSHCQCNYYQRNGIGYIMPPLVHSALMPLAVGQREAAQTDIHPADHLATLEKSSGGAD